MTQRGQQPPVAGRGFNDNPRAVRRLGADGRKRGRCAVRLPLLGVSRAGFVTLVAVIGDKCRIHGGKGGRSSVCAGGDSLNERLYVGVKLHLSGFLGVLGVGGGVFRLHRFEHEIAPVLRKRDIVPRFDLLDGDV
ncbi:MAG: hypothetical protein BWX70_03146 [Verrucomicrobia bacterium ADurb.Bin070]|nr:MAG: hypothetical protein BWX70_03146 [Verrucomicrobia bacterium ADurb.Bin070]